MASGLKARSLTAALCWIAVLLVAGAVTRQTQVVRAQSAKSDLTDPAQAARFIEITKALVCQCGCQQGLGECNHVGCSSAIPLRKEIEMKIRAGESDEAIIKAMVDRFGPVILAAPTGKGFDITAWVTPFIMIVVGLIAIYAFLRTQRKPRLGASQQPVAADPAYDEALRRVEGEIRMRKLQ